MSARSRKVVRRKLLHLADAKKSSAAKPGCAGAQPLARPQELEAADNAAEVWTLLRDLGGAATVPRSGGPLKKHAPRKNWKRCCRRRRWIIGLSCRPRYGNGFSARSGRSAPARPRVRKRGCSPWAWPPAGCACRSHAADIRVLLQCSSAGVRAVGAEIAALQNRADLAVVCCRCAGNTATPVSLPARSWARVEPPSTPPPCGRAC